MSATPENRQDAYRFLIVDDSRAIQAIVRRVVENCQYPNAEIRVASNGQEALDVLNTFKPDLLITDWHMPKVSGLELLQTMRQSGMTDIQVGFITTESSETLLNEARTNGAAFVINKPFRDDILLQRVRETVPHPADATAAPPPSPAAEPVAKHQVAAAEAEATVVEDGPPEFPTPVRAAEPAKPANSPTPAPVAATAVATPAASSVEPAASPAPQSVPAPAASAPPAAEAADAAKPVPLAAIPPLMKTEDCQKLVHATLQEIPFRLIRHDDLQTKDLTAKNLIGLYAGPNKPIAALCVLDTNALCILGGGAGKMPPHIVRAAMAAGAPSEAMVQNATRFMQMAGAILHMDGAVGTAPLSRTSLVPQNFKKLEELLLKNSGRAHFRVAVPGYGEGRLSFLAV